MNTPSHSSWTAVSAFTKAPAFRSLRPAQLARLFVPQGLPGLGLAIVDQRGNDDASAQDARRALCTAAEVSRDVGARAKDATARLLEKAHAAGLVVLPTKDIGVLLRGGFDPAHRSVDIVDLLVPGGALDPTTEYLRSEGFVGGKQVDPDTAAVTWEPLTREDFPLPIEVHDRLETSPLDPEAGQGLFRRSVTVRGHPVLAPVDALVCACAQSALWRKFDRILQTVFDYLLLAEEAGEVVPEQLSIAFELFDRVDPRQALAAINALAGDLLEGTRDRGLPNVARPRWALRKLCRFLAFHPDGNSMVTPDRAAYLVEKLVIPEYGIGRSIKRKLGRLLGAS